jgi:hypothetical protein
MARTKNPHEAAVKSWATRRKSQPRVVAREGPTQMRNDWRSAPTLARRLEEEGGFTYHVVSKRSPTEGFIVSIHPERSQGIDVAKLTPDMLRQYVKENRDLLKERGNYFGAWRDGNRVYLDVSTVVRSKSEAIRLGKEHDQIGIYDIKTGETVIVDENAKSGGAADG